MVDFNEIINTAFDHWYIFAIVILGVLAMIFFLRSTKKKKYHSEIEDHHKVLKETLKLNKTPYKWLVQKDRILGKITGLVEEDVQHIKRIKVKGQKEREVEVKVEKFYILSVKIDGLGIGKYRLWSNEKHLKVGKDLLKFEPSKDIVFFASNKSFLDYLGYYIPTRDKEKVIIRGDFDRTLLGKTIDGMGYQMRKFSEVRDEWGHMMAMKDLEIEKIKEEKKMMGTRAR